MAVTASTAAIIAGIAGIASTAGAAASTYTGYQNAKAQEEASEYNAKVSDVAATQQQMEKSVAIDQQRSSARQVQAQGSVAAAQGGSAGGSAENAILNKWLNLDEDLSALNYNYDTRSTAYKNQASLDRYQAKAAKKNAISSLIGGSLTTIGTAGTGYVNYSKVKGA